MLPLVPLIMNVFPTAGGGADFDKYISYFTHGIAEGHLLLEGNSFAVSHQSPGSYLLWLPYLLLRSALSAAGAVETGLVQCALNANLFLAVALVCMIYRYMKRMGLPRGTAMWALFAAFFATPLCFYSTEAVSSEIPSALMCFALLYAFTGLKFDSFADYALAGALAGLAVDVRANNAIYVLILFGYMMLIKLREAGGVRTFGGFVIAAATGAAAVSLHMVTNCAFTGSPVKFPYHYTFPSGTSAWFDYAHPQVFPVLFSHYHGLLAYCPVFLLAGVAAAAFLARGRTAGKDFAGGNEFAARARVYLLLSALYFAVHLYLAAAWRCWGVGRWSFGGRQFINFAPFVAPALGCLFYRLRGRALFYPIAAAAAACTLWTVALASQGHTSFMETYSELFAAQAEALAGAAASPMFHLFAASLFVLLIYPYLESGRLRAGLALGLVAWGVVSKLAFHPDEFLQSFVYTGLVVAGFLFAANVVYSKKKAAIAATLIVVLAVVNAWMLWGAVSHTEKLIREDPRIDVRPRIYESGRCVPAPFDTDYWLKNFEMQRGLPGEARWERAIEEFRDLESSCREYTCEE